MGFKFLFLLILQSGQETNILDENCIVQRLVRFQRALDNHSALFVEHSNYHRENPDNFGVFPFLHFSQSLKLLAQFMYQA